MKKLILALSILTIAFAGSAFAQLEWQNNIGIYTDTGDFNVTAVAFETIPVNVVLTNPTSDNITGYEFNLIEEGGIFLGEYMVDYDYIDAATRPGEHMIGFGAPQPLNGNFVLGHFDILVTDAAVPAHLFIRPIYFSSVEGAPSYANNQGEFNVMLQSTGDSFVPVFLINSPEDPVDTESTSFDGLKSLYR
jgi:hypothetical protein